MTVTCGDSSVEEHLLIKNEVINVAICVWKLVILFKFLEYTADPGTMDLLYKKCHIIGRCTHNTKYTFITMFGMCGVH